jgi:hypothetical protein
MILELLILIIGIAMLMLAHYLRNKERHVTTVEPFESKVASLEEEAYLHACPLGYHSYHLSNGNTACCKGEIVANECMSDEVCLLNGKGTDSMPKCTDVLMASNQTKSQDQCPSSMTTYFEDTRLHKKGCTNGPLNTTLTGPRNTSQPSCTIYNTMDEDLNSLDSCFNQKELENATCFGNNCTKSLVQPISNKPIQIAIGFTDSTGMHRVAYTRASMERFLDATKSNWRNQGMNLDKNINVAEVAKAFYVDRTIQQSDIEL